MSKCHGCGITLQVEDKNALGFTKDLNSDLCERCFRIKHYNDYKRVIKDNNYVLDLLKNIDKKSLVVLVIDIMNIPNSLDILKNIDNDLLLVFSKSDLLPSEMYDDKLEKICKSLNVNYVDKLLVSANKNHNLDLLMEKINLYKKTNKVYFVGFSNSGKSTLLNKIIYNYTNLNEIITTSLLPSTTLDFIEIKINDDLTIIDTPGILEEGNLIDVIDSKYLSKIMPKKKINPRVYQIKGKQIINIEDIISIETSDTNIVVYVSNSLKITRDYNKQIDGMEFNLNKNEDLVIPGLGFITFKNKANVIIKTNYEISIFKRNRLI